MNVYWPTTLACVTGLWFKVRSLNEKIDLKRTSDFVGALCVRLQVLLRRSLLKEKRLIDAKKRLPLTSDLKILGSVKLA